MNEYAVLIPTNKPAHLVKLDGTLAAYQNAVDGYIEIVSVYSLNEDCVLIINEEGKLKHLPLNRTATAIYDNPIDCIVGTALIVKRGEEDIELMNKSEAEEILEIAQKYERISKR